MDWMLFVSDLIQMCFLPQIWKVVSFSARLNHRRMVSHFLTLEIWGWRASMKATRTGGSVTIETSMRWYDSHISWSSMDAKRMCSKVFFLKQGI